MYKNMIKINDLTDLIHISFKLNGLLKYWKLIF
jgi:hypothetical protein